MILALLELVFHVILVHVPVRRELGGDLVGDDAVELTAHVHVAHENHVQQRALVPLKRENEGGRGVKKEADDDEGIGAE